ncbi:MAG: formylglycine-generating enzyme family protein [Planctomycetota bacterium]
MRKTGIIATAALLLSLLGCDNDEARKRALKVWKEFYQLCIEVEKNAGDVSIVRCREDAARKNGFGGWDDFVEKAKKVLGSETWISVQREAHLWYEKEKEKKPGGEVGKPQAGPLTPGKTTEIWRDFFDRTIAAVREKRIVQENLQDVVAQEHGFKDWADFCMKAATKLGPMEFSKIMKVETDRFQKSLDEAIKAAQDEVAALQPPADETKTYRKLPDSLTLDGLKGLLDEGSVVAIPSVEGDQYGNPITEREGSRVDSTTKLPHEIWLKRPGMEFVLVPAGEFVMGSTPGEEWHRPDEGPTRTVKISKPFYMSKYEVTQSQWKLVMNTEPSYFKKDGALKPVEQVVWHGANGFSERLGLALPTEAQWEYACRGGREGPYGIEGGVKALPIHGWFVENSEDRTHVVGRKKPNGFGLYDMLGNVDEWCRDGYDDKFYGSPEAAKPDPVCIKGRVGRVYRGGNIHGESRNLRAAQRNFSELHHKHLGLGFRPIIVFE